MGAVESGSAAAWLYGAVACAFIIGVIALVLGAMAYSQLSLRSSRRDVLFYALSQHPPTGAGVVLMAEPITGISIAPGATAPVYNVQMDPTKYNPNIDGNIMLNLAVTVTSSPMEAGASSLYGTIMFGSRSSNFEVPVGTASGDAVVSFPVSMIASGQPIDVLIANNGSTTIVPTRIRLLTQPRVR